MFVKPAAGLKVRDPATMRLLPDDGQDVPENSFWHARLRDGDVVRATAPALASIPEAPPAPAPANPAHEA